MTRKPAAQRQKNKQTSRRVAGLEDQVTPWVERMGKDTPMGVVKGWERERAREGPSSLARLSEMVGFYFLGKEEPCKE